MSASARAASADAECREASLSGDRSVVAFTSNASNITAGVEGTRTGNVFRRDLTTSLLLGGGAAGHHDRACREVDAPLAVDGFWLAEPAVALQANVTRRMRVGLGGSYRFVHRARFQQLAPAG